MSKKIEAILKSPLFSIVLVLAVVSYYVFKLKRLPTADEIVTHTMTLLTSTFAIYKAIQKMGAEPAVGTISSGGPPAIGTLAFFLAVGLSACGTASTSTLTTGLEGVAADCAAELQPALLPAVQSAFATPGDGYKAKIEKLISTIGGDLKRPGAICAITKAAGWIVTELTGSAGAAAATARDPVAVLTVNNINQWLKDNPSPAAMSSRGIRRRPPLQRFIACAAE